MTPAKRLLADWKQGNWHPGLCEHAWQQLDVSADSHSLYTAIIFQNAIAGFDITQLEHAVAIVDEIKPRWHSATLRLISSCLQCDQKDLACRLVDQQLAGALTPSRYYLLSRNPAVLSLLYETYPEKYSWALPSLKRAANKLMVHSKPLGDSLISTLIASATSTHPVSVAIVGNGPELLNQVEGDEIDAHQLVIRFNKVHLKRRALHPYRPQD